MDRIHNTIFSFLKKYKLDNNNLVYLVAFSGGPDSVCLLNSIHETCPNNRIIAIHLNHCWRGEESDREEENCKQFCLKNNIEFYSEKLNSDIAQTETAARNARYDFFEKCAKKFKCNIIFTAHNQNDNVETLIFRICHGTGISGLQGIAEHRDLYYRPLLNISRKEIEKYCAKNNLPINIDSSNSDNIHKRNLIRNEILPMLSKINPSINEAITSLSYVAKEETSILKEHVNSIFEQISKNNKILTKKYLKLSDELQKRILYEIITPLVPENYDRERILTLWNFIKENCTSKSGKTCSITTDYWLFVSEKNIEIIKPTEKDNTCINVNKLGEYKYGRFDINISKCSSIPDKHPVDAGDTIFVDFSSIENFEFTIRHRQHGDIIQPLGINGTQKLKKYFNSKKIPNHEKDNIVLLTQGKEVLWAVGVGLSNKIKVKTKPTHKIVCKELKGEESGN